jgi:hypothetical protein
MMKVWLLTELPSYQPGSVTHVSASWNMGGASLLVTLCSLFFLWILLDVKFKMNEIFVSPANL